MMLFCSITFMYETKKTNILLSLAFVGYLFFNLAPAAFGFATFGHRSKDDPKANHVDKTVLLITKVHEPIWNIGYRYDAKCKPENRPPAHEVEEAITTALNLWLQPLHDLKPARPITSVFQYHRQKDRKFPTPNVGYDDVAGLLSVDLRVTFVCEDEVPYAIISGTTPEVYIRTAEYSREWLLRGPLAHEIGHVFGLNDTYLDRRSPENPFYRDVRSSGGYNFIVGNQALSIMALVGLYDDDGMRQLFEDDKRGIIWLYKYTYENIDWEDCFFPDYVPEPEVRGCRPKHPLIFDIKHAPNQRFQSSTLQMLDHDPTLDVNAQDADGFTALHYAVMSDWERVVLRLLAHKDILPYLPDKKGRTALDVAREAKLTRMIELLETIDTQQIVGDINGDGTVNILDLVFVASNFGKPNENGADVNGDGVVNIQDLVKVAGLIGDAAP